MSVHRSSSPSRRAVIRGAAATLWLPALASAGGGRFVRGISGGGDPRRIVWWFVPNGLVASEVTPATTGADYALLPVLEPIATDRARVTVLSGLENVASGAATASTHERCMGSLLTDHAIANPLSGPLDAGISADQHAANGLAAAATTPFRSLQLGTGEAYVPGVGNSSVYFTHLSWADGQTPLTPLTDPKMLFDQMFAGTDPDASASDVARRKALRHSVLDASLERVEGLRAKLDPADVAKLDQYATAVRELEQRITALDAVVCEAPDAPVANLPLAERIDAMTDLMVLALQCDYTRILTFMAGPTSALTAFTDLGITKAHHTLSHDYLYHQADADAFREIQRWQVERWATFVHELAQIPDGDGGDLLSNTLVALTTEFGEPSAHAARPLPVLLAGGEAGGVAQGVHRAVATQPHSNLWRAMIAFSGADPAGFGDNATGTLDLG